MFSITFQFGPQQTPWTLLFKSQQTMDSAIMMLDAGHPTELVSISDDFGQKLRVRKDAIQAMLIEDMLESQLAHIERGLHTAITQAKFQTRANADTTIRASQRPQSPAVFNPMINGRGF